MRIATWNIERLKHLDKKYIIERYCSDAGADILVLTETDNRIDLDYANVISTPPAKDVISDLYQKTENRVTIYTNYPIVERYDTYDEYTALCVELETERGRMMVYGTIMGVFGNREKSYAGDLKKQIKDIRRLSAMGDLCVIGDYNCSFSDNYYFTKAGRDSLNAVFSDCMMSILTESQPECIDHIAVSDGFTHGADISVTEWNEDKALSDHKGIVVDIS